MSQYDPPNGIKIHISSSQNVACYLPPNTKIESLIWYLHPTLERVMNRLPLILFLVFGAAAVDAECLEVSDQRYEMQSTEVGGVTVNWTAEIENQCDAAFDADVTVHFRDSSGTSVYETRDWATLEQRERRQIGRLVHISSAYEKAIAAIDVRVIERERPL